MNQHNEFPQKILYEYTQEVHTPPQYAHGVWGGINPQGEIELNFYLESDKLPSRSECLISPDGSFGHEIAPVDGETRTIVRHIHSRVLLNYTTARAILEWLEDKISTLEMEDGTPLLYSGNTELEQ